MAEGSPSYAPLRDAFFGVLHGALVLALTKREKNCKLNVCNLTLKQCDTLEPLVAKFHEKFYQTVRVRNQNSEHRRDD